MDELKELSKKELLKEYESYEQLIQDIGCFGTKDLIWFDQICKEIQRRGLQVRVVTRKLALVGGDDE